MSILVSAHNPMTGPRHLGHFASTMAAWPELARDHQLVVVIDDLIPALLYPRALSDIQERTMAVVRECLAIDVDFTGDHHLLLASMVPEAHEMAFYASMVMDLSWCEALYRESFAGLLSTYQRAELGLPRTRTLAELAYPQCHLAALTLGLRAEVFQGGEEMRGYMDIMVAISERYRALAAPRFSGRATFVLGTDAMHMASENAIYLSAPAAQMEAQVRTVNSPQVFENWACALGCDELKTVSRSVAESDLAATLHHAQSVAIDLLRNTLAPFTQARFSDADMIRILEKSSAFARKRVQETAAMIKSELQITGYAS